VKGLAEVWAFEKLQFSLYTLLIKDNKTNTFSKTHILANQCCA
jgi:hypothetical protein